MLPPHLPVTEPSCCSCWERRFRKNILLIEFDQILLAKNFVRRKTSDFRHRTEYYRPQLTITVSNLHYLSNNCTFLKNIVLPHLEPILPSVNVLYCGTRECHPGRELFHPHLIFSLAICTFRLITSHSANKLFGRSWNQKCP